MAKIPSDKYRGNKRVRSFRKSTESEKSIVSSETDADY